MHRVLTQVYRNFDKCVPDPGDLGEADRELIGKAEAAMDAVAESLEAVRLREALNVSMALARDANRYLDAQAPWQQVKTDKAAAGRTLYTAMQALMALRVTLNPFLPFSTQRLHELLGRDGNVEDVGWRFETSEPGAPLPEPKPLFTKLDDSVADEMLAKLG